MARYIYQGNFVDLSGNAVSSGTITVYLAGTTTLASVYTVSSGGTAVNSVTSDSTGKFVFYVDISDYNADQKFKIVLSKSGFLSKTYDDITIYDIPEYIYYADSSATDQSIDANDNSIADLLAKIGTSNIRTIVCKQGTYTFSTTKDLSAYTNVTLKIQPGADFAVATGVTITLGCKAEAGLQKWISLTGTGVVTFGSGSVKEVYPQWWSENVVPGTTDMTVAIQAAVNSIKATGGKVSLLANKYLISSFIDLSTLGGLTIEGVGHADAGAGGGGTTGTIIINSGDGDAFKIQSLSKVIMRNMDIFDSFGAGRSQGAGIHAVRAGNTILHLENIYVRSHYDGFKIERPVLTTITHCTTAANLNHGFLIASSDSGAYTSTLIQNCYSASNVGDGYHLDGGSYTTLVNCASDSNNNGYVVAKDHAYNPNTISFIGCGAEVSAHTAFLLSNGASITAVSFLGCQAYGQIDGFVVNDAQNVTMIGCKTVLNTGSGIDATNSTSGSLTVIGHNHSSDVIKVTNEDVINNIGGNNNNYISPGSAIKFKSAQTLATGNVPNIAASNIWKTANVGATTITAVNGAIDGGIYVFIGNDGGNTTFSGSGGTIKLAGGVNFTLGNGDIIMFISDGTNLYEINRSDNS